MKLIAPADKVGPYLAWLAIQGKELSLRPAPDEASLRQVLADYGKWSDVVSQALGRAFEGDELAGLRVGSPPLSRAGLRTRLRVDLAVIMVAQSYVPEVSVAE